MFIIKVLTDSVKLLTDNILIAFVIRLFDELGINIIIFLVILIILAAAIVVAGMSVYGMTVAIKNRDN